MFHAAEQKVPIVTADTRRQPSANTMATPRIVRHRTKYPQC